MNSCKGCVPGQLLTDRRRQALRRRPGFHLKYAACVTRADASVRSRRPRGFSRRSPSWGRGIQEALNGSLKRLQTDYVDLYQIHSPDRYQPLFGNIFYDPKQERPTLPIEDQLEAVAEFRRGCQLWPRPRTPTTCSTAL